MRSKCYHARYPIKHERSHHAVTIKDISAVVCGSWCVYEHAHNRCTGHSRPCTHMLRVHRRTRTIPVHVHAKSICEHLWQNSPKYTLGNVQNHTPYGPKSPPLHTRHDKGQYRPPPQPRQCPHHPSGCALARSSARAASHRPSSSHSHTARSSTPAAPVSSRRVIIQSQACSVPSLLQSLLLHYAAASPFASLTHRSHAIVFSSSLQPDPARVLLLPLTAHAQPQQPAARPLPPIVSLG